LHDRGISASCHKKLEPSAPSSGRTGACARDRAHAEAVPGAADRLRRDAGHHLAARGGLVDEPALVAALQEGGLAGAALDVFDPEPPLPGNPLYAMPNVVPTPHVAAGTRDAFMEKRRFIFDNLARFWKGEPVENLVDLSPTPGRVT
jgi:hypothetical protein